MDALNIWTFSIKIDESIAFESPIYQHVCVEMILRPQNIAEPAMEQNKNIVKLQFILHFIWNKHLLHWFWSCTVFAWLYHTAICLLSSTIV